MTPAMTSPAQSNLGTAVSQSPHWLQWDAPNSPPKLLLPLRQSWPHLIHPYLDRPHSPSPMSSRSTQLFCHNTFCRQNDRLTDRLTDILPDGPSRKLLMLTWQRATRLTRKMVKEWVLELPAMNGIFVCHVCQFDNIARRCQTEHKVWYTSRRSSFQLQPFKMNGCPG